MGRWFLLLVLCGSPAHAQTAMERIEPRLARAIEEHRVFLTCSSLDGSTFGLVQRSWLKMVADAREHLASRYTPMADLAAFDRRTAVSALLDTKQTLGEAIAFCERHPKWAERYARLNWTVDIDDRPLR